MLKWGMVFAAAAALPAIAVAKDPEPEVLKRNGQWVIDYDRDGCHLAAQFGSGDGSVLARLSRYQPGDGFDFSIFGNRLKTDGRPQALLDFGLPGAPVETQGFRTGTLGKLPGIFFGEERLDGWPRKGEWPLKEGETAPPVTPDMEAAVHSATVSIMRKPTFRLEFGSMREPSELMRHCMTTLIESWGYDPKVQATLSRPLKPVGAPADWLLSSDFPTGALNNVARGLVRFRLDVDAAGKVARCNVLSRPSPDLFADTACRALSRRAKYEPARDAQGRPVASFIMQNLWHSGG